jgi:N-methylhydantoinase B/oxoprolinase/acetone carboxylase alpha subunit
MPFRAIAATLATLALAACGEERSDVSAGVDAMNREMAREGVRLDCPDEVDGAAGAEFHCQLKGTQTRRTVRVEMRIVKQDDQLAVDFAGERERVQTAIARVTEG